MFGGIAFMIAGNMAVGVINDDLMVRLDPADAERALGEPHTRPMDFTGKPAKKWSMSTRTAPSPTRTSAPGSTPAPISPPRCRRSRRSRAPTYDRRVASQNGNELFLLDGNSLAYRAFFALPESIATADGRPTNAIYGLASMLGKIVVEHRPAGLIAAWDAGMSGREKTYDLYKAQRPSRPDLLREQWPHLMPLIEAFGYTNVRAEGYEADDVIGTLARRAQEEGIPVMVVSGDRDVYQLVGDGVRVMTTSRGVTETKVYDRDGVIERYGVPPELVTDLIGLKGDTSDNIPGVPGIGDKTAAQLLQEFGSLEEVLANVDKVSGAKRKQNLVEHAEDARVSKELATLQFDVETGIDFGEVMGVRPDRSTLREFMREFELRAVMERLEEGLEEDEAVPGRRVETELEVEVIEGTPGDLSDGGAALAIDGDRWAAAQGDRILGGTSSLDELAVALAGRPITGHDLKSLGGGRHGLLAAAVREGVELELEHDTMLAAYVLEPQRRTYELTELAADAGIGIAATEAAGGGDSEDGQLALGEEPEAGTRSRRGGAPGRGSRRRPAPAARRARARVAA